MPIKSLGKAFKDAFDETSIRYDGVRFYKRNAPLFSVYAGRNRLVICCGIDELNLLNFGKFWAFSTSKKDITSDDMRSCLAKFISYGVRGPRPMVVGIPQKVGAGSQYDLKFYEWVTPILKDFGFVNVTKPYKNANSLNTLIMLVGMLP